MSRYTVVSGTETETNSFEGLSIVVLNRGGKPFKNEVLTRLCELNTPEIISVETSEKIYEMEMMARKLSPLKFLFLSPDISVGERINIAVQEAAGSHVLVLWNDMHLQIGAQSGRLFRQAVSEDVLCSIPVLMNPKKETIPTRIAPGFSRRKLEVYPLRSVKNHTPTLYPFDFCGIYNRQKFLLTGGYDPAILSPYWQKLDFGFRAFLWGETIRTYTGIKMNYINDIPKEDITRDSCYRKFFLKNLALRYTGDSCVLPFTRFLSFLIQSGGGVVNSFRDYRIIGRWVKDNRYRFKTDPYNLTELWEVE